MGKYSIKSMTKALEETNGLVYLAAKKLGCARQTIYNTMERHPELWDVIHQARGEFVDIGEQKLRQAVESGEAWAIALVLRTLGKDRGYVERQEMTGKDGQPMRLQVEAFDYDVAVTPIAARSNGHHATSG